MLLKLAFRNVWRNKRRTFITLAAVLFAVFLSSVLRSFQKGAWDNVFDTSINTFFGYVQIHKDGFWDDQTIDNSFESIEVLEDDLLSIANVKGVAPRLESFALASAGELTQGVAVIGVDPIKEDRLTGIRGKIEQGSYLKRGGCIIAEGIASKLKLSVTDTLVLISQGFRGANAAGKYPINGIFRYALPDLNKTLVFLDLPSAQELYAAEGRLTSLALHIEKSTQVADIVDKVKAVVNQEDYEVMDYKELMPELVQARQLDEGGGYVTIGILYILIAFAIFGTIIMMTQERRYEYGVLTSIGMGRWTLFSVTFLETIILAVAGTLLGILLAMPVVYYLHIHPLDLSKMGNDATAAFENFGMEPIVPAAFSASVFARQALIIFLITVLLGIYPLYKILKLNPVTAMRS